MTFDGLNSNEFKEIKESLNKDIELLSKTINSNTGHLGDIIASIETIISSIRIKKVKLSDIFIDQKIKIGE